MIYYICIYIYNLFNIKPLSVWLAMLFFRYDIVSIESDKVKVKKLEKGHGGWSKDMVSVSLSTHAQASNK